MGLIAIGIVLLLVGLVLAFTNVGDMIGITDAFGLTMMQIGWILVGIGVVLALLSLLLTPRWGFRRRHAY